MGVLLLERLGIAGVPVVAELDVGMQYAAVVADVDQARRLSDVVTGLADPPMGAVVRRYGDRPVCLVPAEGGLLPHLTVEENLVRSYRATHRRAPRTMAAKAGKALVKQCGLDNIRDHYPHQIAPGRRRRAGVARALCAEAAVIVLEDSDGLPTWGSLLDPDRDPGLLRAAMLLVTHDRGRAAGFLELGSA